MEFSTHESTINYANSEGDSYNYAHMCANGEKAVLIVKSSEDTVIKMNIYTTDLSAQIVKKSMLFQNFAAFIHRTV